MISAFELYGKDIKSIIMKPINQSVEDLTFTKLGSKYWTKLEAISNDYAIMEKVKNLVAIPYQYGLLALGNWVSVWREPAQNDNGVDYPKKLMQ